MAWYDGFSIEKNGEKSEGKTLLDALDSITPPCRPTDKPLRLPLVDVYEIGGMKLFYVSTGLPVLPLNFTLT